MASTDRQHEKKLREAEKAYNKWKKAFLAGKISKDELKEHLRPFKYELNELNLVKLKEGDLPPEAEKESGSEDQKVPETKPMASVSYPPWKKRSSITMDEIEERVDLLSLDSRPSETLQMLYEKRYGEELSPPSDPVTFKVESEDDEEYLLPGASIRQLPSFEEEEKEEDTPGELEGPVKRKERKPFWKGLGRRKKDG